MLIFGTNISGDKPKRKTLQCVWDVAQLRKILNISHTYDPADAWYKNVCFNKQVLNVAACVKELSRFRGVKNSGKMNIFQGCEVCYNASSEVVPGGRKFCKHWQGSIRGPETKSHTVVTKCLKSQGSGRASRKTLKSFVVGQYGGASVEQSSYSKAARRGKRAGSKSTWLKDLFRFTTAVKSMYLTPCGSNQLYFVWLLINENGTVIQNDALERLSRNSLGFNVSSVARSALHFALRKRMRREEQV